MRTLILAAGISVLAISFAFAESASPMARPSAAPRAGSCATMAMGSNGKPLSGAAKTSFMNKCKKDACEPKAVDKNGKPLVGAAKASFMKNARLVLKTSMRYHAQA
jgi:hypothetical protein